MTIGEMLEESGREAEARQRARCGTYNGESCVACGRVRVMICGDEVVRCEKCWWAPDLGRYDEP